MKIASIGGCGRMRLFAALLAGGLAGCHSRNPLTPQQAEGKHLYDVRCAHCHEDNDLALKKVPPNLHGLFEHKTLPSGIPATDAAVAANVLNGRGMMPGFAGRFTNEQMAALLAYLHIPLIDDAGSHGLHKKSAGCGMRSGLHPAPIDEVLRKQLQAFRHGFDHGSVGIVVFYRPDVCAPKTARVKCRRADYS